MNQQTLPLLMDFKDILSGSASLFLNQQNAGGMNFWGVFLYYLSSPFSFLVLIVEKADFFRLANVLVALKMAACSVTAFAFFRRRFSRLSAVQAVVLSVLYACSGYVLMYYQNIAWLDTVYLFPRFFFWRFFAWRNRKNRPLTSLPSRRCSPCSFISATW